MIKRLLAVAFVMSLAVCSFASEKETHNGIGGFSPIKISLFPPIEIPPSMVTNTIGGLDYGIFATKTGTNYGLQGSMFSTRSSVLYGLQNGFYTRAYEMYGLQYGAVSIIKEKGLGLQIGALVAESGDFEGFQLGGLYSKTGKSKGVQFGAFTYAEEMTGLQLGIFNYTKVMNAGVQIGVINMIGNGIIVLPLVNAKF